MSKALIADMAAAAAILLVTLAALTLPDADLGAISIAVTAALAVLMLIAKSFRARGRRRLALLASLALYLLFLVWMQEHYSAARDHVRWFFLSGSFKARILAAPEPGSSELKHVEWDGWGFMGSDTTVYLAFDPADRLAGAAEQKQPIRARGIPCPVYQIRQLEDHWYAVQFFTDTEWSKNGCGP